MRLYGLDIARFLAFCGMVLVNFRIAAQVAPGTDLASRLTDALEGRAAALFVVLAGIGLSLGRPDVAEVLRRAVFLFLAGLVNLLIFEADILHFYGLYFLLALPLLSARPTVLLWAATAAVLAGMAGLLTLDYEAHWNWETLTYSDFWTVEGFLRHAFFNGWHPVFPWVAFLYLGMWMGRMDLASRRVQRRLLLWGGGAAVVGGLPGLLVQDPDLLALFDTDTLPPGPVYIIAATGSAAAVIGLVLLLCPAPDRMGLSSWLTVAGRQALSLYVAHILLGMGALEAMGLLDGSLSTVGVFGYSIGFCVLSVVLARGWNSLADRGPLEMLMRWCTRRRAAAVRD